MVKNASANAGNIKRCRFDPWDANMATHSSILAWRNLWRASLAGYSPQGHKELDTTKETQDTYTNES